MSTNHQYDDSQDDSESPAQTQDAPAQQDDSQQTTALPAQASSAPTLVDALGAKGPHGQDADFIRSMDQAGGYSPEEIMQHHSLANTLDAQDTYEKMSQLGKMYQGGAITSKQLADASDQLYNQRVPDGKMGVSFTNSSDPNGSLTHVIYDPKTGKAQSQVMTPDQVFALHSSAMAALGNAIDAGKARQEATTNAQTQQKIDSESHLQDALAGANIIHGQYMQGQTSINQEKADAAMYKATHPGGAGGANSAVAQQRLNDAEIKTQKEDNAGFFKYDQTGAGSPTENPIARTAFLSYAQNPDGSYSAPGFGKASNVFANIQADAAKAATDAKGQVDPIKYHQIYTQKVMAFDNAIKAARTAAPVSAPRASAIPAPAPAPTVVAAPTQASALPVSKDSRVDVSNDPVLSSLHESLGKLDPSDVKNVPQLTALGNALNMRKQQLQEKHGRLTNLNFGG